MPDPTVWTVPESLSALEAAKAYFEPLDPGRYIVTVDDNDILREYKLDAVDGSVHSVSFVPQISGPHTFSVRKVS